MSGWVAVAEVVAAVVAAGGTGRSVARTARAARVTVPLPRASDTGVRGPRSTLARAEHAAYVHLAGDVHVVLRPLLTEIASERLLARGVDVEREPSRARDVLGDELWDVVRPDRPPPRDGLAETLTRDDLSALLDRMEAI